MWPKVQVLLGRFPGRAPYSVNPVVEHEREIGRTNVRTEWDEQIPVDKIAAAAHTAEWQARSQIATTKRAKREEAVRSLAASAALLLAV